MPSRSGQRLRQTAEITPMTMPNVTDQTMLASVSHNVGMKRSAISVDTGRLVRSEVPEVALQHMAEVANELLRQQQVQAQLLAHQLDRFLVGFRPGGQARRVAGQHVHEKGTRPRPPATGWGSCPIDV